MGDQCVNTHSKMAHRHTHGPRRHIPLVAWLILHSRVLPLGGHVEFFTCYLRWCLLNLGRPSMRFRTFKFTNSSKQENFVTSGALDSSISLSNFPQRRSQSCGVLSNFVITSLGILTTLLAICTCTFSSGSV